tara:strand:- start:775 stop:1275 length:501 start_codon:yes stop_codon:yes gene_type:complete
MAKKKPNFKMRKIKEPLLADDDLTYRHQYDQLFRLKERSPGFAKLSPREQAERIVDLADERYFRRSKEAGSHEKFKRKIIEDNPAYFRNAAKRLAKGEPAQHDYTFTEMGVRADAKRIERDEFGKETKKAVIAARKKEAARINKILDEAETKKAMRKAAEAKARKK